MTPPILSRTRFKPLKSLVLPICALVGLTLQTDAMANPGYANLVKSWCIQARRPAPVFTADECSTCHQVSKKISDEAKCYKDSGYYYNKQCWWGVKTDTPNKQAFRSRNLDVFCPAATAQNTAPKLTLSPSGIIAVSTGQAIKITAAATDPDNNPVTLTATGLPVDADFNVTAGTGVLTWTPTASGVYTFTLQAIDQPTDASQAKTVQQTVTVRVTEEGGANTPPQLDLITSPQSVTTQSKLRLNVTAVDAEGDELVLAANNLPTGAQFNLKGLVAGKWTGEFTWQAQASQIGKRFTIPFIVREKSTSPILQDSQDVEFQVMAPTTDASIKQVVIDQANYRNGNLTVSGRVKFKSAAVATSGLSVTVTDANGASYGQAKLAKNGNWKLTVPVATDSVPCRIQAAVNGIVSVIQSVKPLKPVCRNVTLVNNSGLYYDDEGDDQEGDDDGMENHDHEENEHSEHRTRATQG